MPTDPNQPGTEYSYRVDEDGTIRDTSANWDEFAFANKGDQACAPCVIGSKLWDNIDNTEVVHLYRTLLERVAHTGRTARVRINCDSPTQVRKMELKIRRVAPGSLELSSRLVEVQNRPPVRLLDNQVERSDEFVGMCSFCKSIRVREDPELWQPTVQAVETLGLLDRSPMPAITHGICPSCYQRVMAELDDAL